MLLFPSAGKIYRGCAMSGAAQPSRVGEYRNQAAMLRSLAFQTRFTESRVRLLALADSFEKLAERVEARETSAVNAAD